MGILNGAKEQITWGNLTYLGGYPGKTLPFVCAFHKEGNEIVLYGGAVWRSMFSIAKDDILNLEIRRGMNKKEDRIVMKIRYEGMELDLQFKSSNLQLSYNKMVSTIHSNGTEKTIQCTNNNESKKVEIVNSKENYASSEKTKFYKGKGFKIGMAVIVLAFIFKGCGSKPNDTSSTSTTNTNKHVEQKQEVKQEETKPKEVEQLTYKILNNIEEVKANFNNAAAKLNIGFRINNLIVKDGEKQNTAQCMLNDHIGIMSTINKKDNTVREVMMIAQGDGTTKSAENMIVVAGTLIATAEPGISNEDRAQLIKELGIPSEIKDGFERDVTHNNFKYHVSLSNSIGFMFSIGNDQDK